MRKGLWKLSFVILTVWSCAAYAGRCSAENAYGFALRENALFLRPPIKARLGMLPRETFGISETALRGYARLSKEHVSFEAALETRGSFISSGMGIGALSGFFTRSSPIERWDLTLDHASTASTQIHTRLESLRLSVKTGPVDIDIGRQAISLGTSHFVSVLDVIAPFAPGTLDATYKPGVDAVRIRSGAGHAGEAEIILVGARRWEDGAIVAKARASIFAQDVVALGGRFRERGFGGLAWEGEISPFTIWGELGLFERKPDEEHFFGGWKKAAFSGIAGAEVMIAHDVRTGFALMHQDFGARDPKDLYLAYAAAPVREGWVFLGSSSYAVFTVNRKLHPLATADLSGLANLDDGSTLWQPRVTFSVSDNSDLSVYGWIGTGPGPRSSGLFAVPRSEFGLMPDGAGMYCRWFF